jgi:hypothetical protein
MTKLSYGVPMNDRRISPDSQLPLVADVFSYTYAVAICAFALMSEVQYSILQAVLMMVVFVLLRGVARELHKDRRRARRAAGMPV